MKILMYLFLLVVLFGCQQKEAATEERSIGFLTSEPNMKWHLGTEGPIQIVKDLDQLWLKKDFDSMRPFFVDTANFYFPDGTVLKSPDEFIAAIKKMNEGATYTWTFDYAFSVDLDPKVGGEHVQAGFTVTEVKGGVTSKQHLNESYYIIQGKVVNWSQSMMTIKDE
jgi:hypothetical protein